MTKIEWKKIIIPILIGFLFQVLLIVGGFWASYSVMNNEVQAMKAELHEAKVLVLKEKITNLKEKVNTVSDQTTALDKKLDEIIVLIIQN